MLASTSAAGKGVIVEGHITDVSSYHKKGTPGHQHLYSKLWENQAWARIFLIKCQVTAVHVTHFQVKNKTRFSMEFPSENVGEELLRDAEMSPEHPDGSSDS